MVFEFNTNNTYDFLINEYKNKDWKIYLNNYRDFLDNEIRKHYNSENIDNDKVSQKINNYIPESLINLQQLRQDIFTPSSKKITLVWNIKNSIKYFDWRECNLWDYDSILNSELFNIEWNIISNKTSEFNIGGINVNWNINIHNANDILFNDCKIKYNTRINPYKKGDKEINIILNNTFSKNIIIEWLKWDKEKTNSLILLYNKDLPELELINEFKLSWINNINSLNFFFYKNRKYIKKFIISELITENSSDSKYNITGLYVDELKLGNIHNNSDNFVFTNCKINKLVIKNSNLWKAVFNWVEIWKLEIENATLNDCIFNWVDFKTYKLWDNNWKITTKTLKDNYRQLKHVMDKNWNHTEANEFFAREMKKHYQSLKWYDINKIILLIQWVISYYWNSWLLPIIWIVLFWINTSLLSWDAYFYYNISLLNHNNIDFYNLFFTNINPFNKNLLTENQITYWLFLHKIVLIILYYQLIVALKRNTRR